MPGRAEVFEEDGRGAKEESWKQVKASLTRRVPWNKSLSSSFSGSSVGDMSMLIMVIGLIGVGVIGWRHVSRHRMMDEWDTEWQRRVDARRDQYAKRLNEKGGKFYGD